MEFKFIKLNLNEKTPIKKSSFNITYELDKIDINKYNIGLMAGASFIILDIDEKDGGQEEFNKYINENGEPLTMKQATPNNGYHYIFNKQDPTYNEEEKQLISELKNKSKYRKKGLDIRINNGYIVFQPSTINGKAYKLLNDLQPAKMPQPLLKWLLEFENKTEQAINNNLIIMKTINRKRSPINPIAQTITTEQQIKNILSYLSDVNSSEWLQITTAIKNLHHKYNTFEENELIKIWDDWSKTQKNYNKKNNLKIWRGITNNINMNSIIIKINEKLYNNGEPTAPPLPLLESFKPLEEEEAPQDIEKIIMNEKYLFETTYNGAQYDYKTFKKYDTIIIKSTTGTGKTSGTAKHIKRYFKHNTQYKFLSLITLKTMTAQHSDSFKHINIKSYEDKKTDFEDDNIIICLNSLGKYSQYDGAFFKNYIVYMDEITAILNSLTGNKLLNPYLKIVYIILTKIINNAHKIIVSDAVINKNVFSLLENRKNKIYIENQFKKYQDIKAIKFNDEELFLKEILKHVENNEYFLFGLDSLKKASEYKGAILQSINEENKERKKRGEEPKEDNIIFISGEDEKDEKEKEEIKDATKYFKNKFVIYTPAIVQGVDNNNETPQDVFIYINGGGDILNAFESFQQTTRTRNIRKLYFYINKVASRPAKYNELEDIETEIKNYELNSMTNIFNMCLTSEGEFNENLYFKLFSYNLYTRDTVRTNNEQHYKNILINNGFNYKEVGENNQLKNVIKYILKGIAKEEADKKFEDHAENIKENKFYTRQTEFLNIETKEQLNKYKGVITDKYLLEDYLNIIKLFRPVKYINNKCFMEQKQTTEYKAIFTTNYKIKLIAELEKELNIQRFNFNNLHDIKQKHISPELLKKINVSFRCETKPEKTSDIIKYYIKRLNNIIGKKIKLFEKKRARTATEEDEEKPEKGPNKKKNIYTLNMNTLSNILNLYELGDPMRKNLINCSFFPPLDKEKAQLKMNEMIKNKQLKYIKADEPKEPEFNDNDNNDNNDNELNYIDNIELIELYELPDKSGLDYGL